MNTSDITAKMNALFDTLPDDLILMIMLSGLSLKTETVAKVVEVAGILNAQRIAQMARDDLNKNAVATLEDFKKKLDKPRKKKVSVPVE